MVFPADKQDRVLINVHGGGFNSDSGSLNESIPIANLTRTKVVSVLYRLAPEHPFPAAVDDTVAVYRELLKTYKPQNMALYGTSAGAILTAEAAVKFKQLGLPLPAALGIFTGSGDFSKEGDSHAIYTVRGFAGYLEPPTPGVQWLSQYVGSTDPKDPGPLACLCRSARDATGPLRNQYARPATERYGDTPSCFSACRSGGATGGFRRSKPRLLV